MLATFCRAQTGKGNGVFQMTFYAVKTNNKALCKRGSECNSGSWCCLGRWAHRLKKCMAWVVCMSNSAANVPWCYLCSSDLLFAIMNLQQGGAKRFSIVSHLQVILSFSPLSSPFYFVTPVFLHLIFTQSPSQFSLWLEPFSQLMSIFSCVSPLSPSFSLLECSKGRSCQCVVCQCGNSREHRGP